MSRLDTDDYRRWKRADEFRQWRRAPAREKDDVVYGLVFFHMLNGDHDFYTSMPSVGACLATGNLDAMMVCGKRLADCQLDDVKAMRDWHFAIARAAMRVADVLGKSLEPSLDDARKTIIRLIRSRAS